jgi:hypothetical protein
VNLADLHLFYERISNDVSLREQHATRVACAEKNLSRKPMTSHGIKRLIQEARSATAVLLRPELLEWLRASCSPLLRIVEEGIARKVSLSSRGCSSAAACG